MNKKQLIVMWVGIAIVVLMGIFTPWVAIEEATHHYLGYRFILSPPDETWFLHLRDKPGIDQIGIVDFTQLLIQWIMVSVIVGGLIITFKDKKSKDEQKQ